MWMMMMSLACSRKEMKMVINCLEDLTLLYSLMKFYDVTSGKYIYCALLSQLI